MSVYRICAELAKGSAPKQIVDDLPRNSTEFVRITGCSIPEGTLFVGGDIQFRESLGFTGSLAGDVHDDVSGTESNFHSFQNRLRNCR